MEGDHELVAQEQVLDHQSLPFTTQAQEETDDEVQHLKHVPACTQDRDLHTRPREVLPPHNLVDTGYLAGKLLVSSQIDYGVDLVGPVPGDSSWQALANRGFACADFAIDWAAQHVTCPAGQTSDIWTPARDRHGNDVLHVAFRRADCARCPDRPNCTRATASGRELTLRPREEHLAVQPARVRQTTPAFKKDYARRAGIEGTLSQAVHRTGLRRSRYVGFAKSHLQHLASTVTEFMDLGEELGYPAFRLEHRACGQGQEAWERFATLSRPAELEATIQWAQVERADRACWGDS